MTPAVLRIGRYPVESVIGTGAFATVYRAVDERLGATVAVKLLADNHCLDPDIRARFLDEGRALRRIESPHVVRVYDVGETDRMQPYLVLEHADRGTLAQRVAALRSAGWRPSAGEVGALAAQLAAAVGAVHAAELVHRDLSPGNVLLRSVPPGPGGAPPEPAPHLVGPDERLLLTDLGLSKDLARSSGLTAAGGTDGFRPPEQRGGPSRVDGRADLWALSAMVLWLLTGRAPATDPPGAVEVDRALADLRLPGALRAPLLRSLDDDPAARHPDAASWRAEVEAALRPPAPPPLTVAPSRPGRRWWAAVAFVVAGALVGAAGTWWAASGGDAPAEVRRRDDGQVDVVDRVGDARITLTGPSRAPVGDVVTFEARAEGVDHWAWLMPDSTVYADRASVQLGSSSPGVAPVVLVAQTPGGERLEVTHEVRFVEE